jgi:hypothetical protein
MKFKSFTFYFLSFTWGLPFTLFGLIVAFILRVFGHHSKKFALVRFFEIGKDWGGLELGLFFICNKQSTFRIRCHEFGHAIQNCMFGPLTPFIICIPSVIRYWYRKLHYYRRGKEPKTDYDDIWFEGQATCLGMRFACDIGDKGK